MLIRLARETCPSLEINSHPSAVIITTGTCTFACTLMKKAAMKQQSKAQWKITGAWESLLQHILNDKRHDTFRQAPEIYSTTPADRIAIYENCKLSFQALTNIYNACNLAISPCSHVSLKRTANVFWHRVRSLCYMHAGQQAHLMLWLETRLPLSMTRTKVFLMKSDWSSRVWSERSCYQRCLSRGFRNSLRSPPPPLTAAMPFARTVGIGSLKTKAKLTAKVLCDVAQTFCIFFRLAKFRLKLFFSFSFFRRDGVGGHNSDHMFNVTLIILN